MSRACRRAGGTRPPAVAVEDDAHVMGPLLGVEGRKQPSLVERVCEVAHPHALPLSASGWFGPDYIARRRCVREPVSLAQPAPRSPRPGITATGPWLARTTAVDTEPSHRASPRPRAPTTVRAACLDASTRASSAEQCAGISVNSTEVASTIEARSDAISSRTAPANSASLGT